MTGRVLLAGTGSGCGKTSVMCGLLGALKNRGVPLSAFKCGPDYIDPMFHREILEIPSRNLDLFLCGEEAVRQLLAAHSPAEGLSLIEGVMGLYDGLGEGDTASSAHLSRVTGTPVVLVVNARGKALSLAAQVLGYLDFAPNPIRGIILNGVSPGAYPLYQRILAEHCPQVECLGFLPTIPEAALESRHLGLVTAAEVEDLRRKMELLARGAARHIDLDRLLKIAGEAAPLPPVPREEPAPQKLRIGLAWDRAFCFYYQDNLTLLQDLGAELVRFSPLGDGRLPEGLDGLYLGGGYPELYAEALAENRSLLEDLNRRVTGGLPTIAECGGYMLLCESVRLADGSAYPMAGVLPGEVRMAEKLSHFGYHILRAKEDNLLCQAGEELRAHEFHYSQASVPGDAFAARKPGREGERDCVFATGTLWAGYPHLHFYQNTEIPRRFLERCGKEGTG